MVTVSSVPVARIDVEPRVADLITGQVQQLTATVRDAQGATLAGRSVTWSSSDPTVATVDPAGRVTALKPGDVAVTATSGSASSAAAVAVSLPGRIELSENAVRFVAGYLGPDPDPHHIAVTAGGATRLRDLSVVVRYEQGAVGSWLEAALAATETPTTLTVSPRSQGLGIGVYDARIEVTDPRAGGGPQVIAVRMEVQDPLPVIAVDPDQIVLNGSGPLSAVFTIENEGVGTLTDLNTTVTYSPGAPSGWLSVTQAATEAPTTVQVNAVTRGLGEGDYDAVIEVSTIQPGVAPASIPVRLTIGPAPPALVLRPADVRLSVPVGSSTRTSVQVDNTGGGVITGLGKSVSYGPGQSTGWLLATFSGTSTPTVLNLDASAASLAIGTYNASVEVSGDAPNAPQYVTVVLNVTPTGGSAPLPPSGLVVTALTSDSASLTWTDGSTDEDDFRVERSDDLGTTWTRIATTPADAQSYLDVGLTGGTTYQYRVQACNTFGCSPYGNVAQVTMPVGSSGAPAAPSGMTATPLSAADVDLTWADNSDDESGFELEGRLAGGSWIPIAQLAANTVAVRISGLAPGTGYEFRVRACNTNGCSAWDAATVTTPNPTTVPASPSGLTATSITKKSVSLAWTDNSSDETVFAVQRITGATGSWQTVATLPVGTTTWTDNGVKSREFYYYRVAACNPVGCSGFSNVILLLTP